MVRLLIVLRSSSEDHHVWSCPGSSDWPFVSQAILPFLLPFQGSDSPSTISCVSGLNRDLHVPFTPCTGANKALQQGECTPYLQSSGPPSLSRLQAHTWVYICTFVFEDMHTCDHTCTHMRYT
jgi:hypothetical protein